MKKARPSSPWERENIGVNRKKIQKKKIQVEKQKDKIQERSPLPEWNKNIVDEEGDASVSIFDVSSGSSDSWEFFEEMEMFGSDQESESEEETMRFGGQEEFESPEVIRNSRDVEIYPDGNFHKVLKPKGFEVGAGHDQIIWDDETDRNKNKDLEKEEPWNLVWSPEDEREDENDLCISSQVLHSTRQKYLDTTCQNTSSSATKQTRKNLTFTGLGEPSFLSMIRGRTSSAPSKELPQPKKSKTNVRQDSMHNDLHSSGKDSQKMDFGPMSINFDGSVNISFKNCDKHDGNRRTCIKSTSRGSKPSSKNISQFLVNERNESPAKSCAKACDGSESIEKTDKAAKSSMRNSLNRNRTEMCKTDGRDEPKRKECPISITFNGPVNISFENYDKNDDNRRTYIKSPNRTKSSRKVISQSLVKEESASPAEACAKASDGSESVEKTDKATNSSMENSENRIRTDMCDSNGREMQNRKKYITTPLANETREHSPASGRNVYSLTSDSSDKVPPVKIFGKNKERKGEMRHSTKERPEDSAEKTTEPIERMFERSVLSPIHLVENECASVLPERNLEKSQREFYFQDQESFGFKKLSSNHHENNIEKMDHVEELDDIHLQVEINSTPKGPGGKTSVRKICFPDKESFGYKNKLSSNQHEDDIEEMNDVQQQAEINFNPKSPGGKTSDRRKLLKVKPVKKYTKRKGKGKKTNKSRRGKQPEDKQGDYEEFLKTVPVDDLCLTARLREYARSDKYKLTDYAYQRLAEEEKLSEKEEKSSCLELHESPI